jgi:general secretion pathway protein G
MNRSPVRRPGHRSGFTLVEIIVVIIILGVLATLIAPRLIGRVGQAKTSTASANAATLSSAMQTLIADLGKIPEGATIDILFEKPSEGGDAWKGPYVQNPDQLKDPWGRKFILLVPGRKNVDFDIVSYGADGKPGGSNDDVDVTKP